MTLATVTRIRSAREPEVDELLDAFAAYQRSAGLAEATIRNRRHILGHLAATSGKTFTEMTVHDLRAHIGRVGISQSSRRTERNAIRTCFDFMLEEGVRDDDPSARLPAVRVPRRQPRPFSPQQIEAMLTSGAYRKTRAMILLGYYQGFRVSSIAAVHARDIDLAEGTIRTIAKGSKDATLPLHPVIAQLALVMPTDDWWFPARGDRRGDGPVRGRAVTDQITDAKRRAGITDPTLTPHSLRHSFATHLVEGGVDIRVVQELMLHESLSSTQVYTGVSAGRKREALTFLDAVVVPERSGRLR